MAERNVVIADPKQPEVSRTLRFPDLPVTEALDELAEAIREHPVVVVVGETGSGKTTQLPKLCLALGRGRAGMIVHTQPRRLAARAVASRIAEELDSPLGELCGYQVRFQRVWSARTAVKLVTDGVLLAEFREDRLLSRYDTVIIDEAHERSLNIDFLLGILSGVLKQRSDLKVIITSATINYERFSDHFGGAPVVMVSGRTYPVELRYAPLSAVATEGVDGSALAKAIQTQLFELRALDRNRGGRFGDLLVFLPGEREIREVSQFLRHAAIDRLDVLPLYARLGTQEQQRIFHPSGSGNQRIVLATNVAETSLTVPGIRYVIDSGLARVSRYAPRSRLQRLPIEPISQASANQRAGRCGRTEPGVCVRLFEESDFQSRSAFTDPEILRTNLASVVLQCIDLGLPDFDEFPFVDRPEPSLIRDGLNQLKELDLITQDHRLTRLGHQVARLPLDPRIGRMLLAAETLKVFYEVSVVAAALSIADPREAGFSLDGIADAQSDFVTLIHLWGRLEAERSARSNQQFKAWCVEHHLNANRVREWREVHRQIVLCFPKTSHAPADGPLDRRAIHVALLTGLAPQIGRLDGKDYLGVRNRRFWLPKGALEGKPQWVMAAELIETHRVVARVVARIEPEWVIEAVPRLLKFSQSEPFWSKKQGRALCYQSTRLFGLTLKERQPVGLSAHDRGLARELFLREAVIGGEVVRTLPFMRHNQTIFQQCADMEAKLRRSDAFMEPEDLIPWFDARIPESIVDMRALLLWWKTADHGARQSLQLALSDVTHNAQVDTDLSLFPERMALGHLELPTSYQFKPGDAADGVSVTVPLTALMQLKPEALEWTVPGAVADKAEALIRGLPKSIRRQLVPVPDFVKHALDGIDRTRESLTEGLARLIRQRTGVAVSAEQWAHEALDNRLRIRIEVVDADGVTIDSDRDLTALQARLKHQVPRIEPRAERVWHAWPAEHSFPERVVERNGGVQMDGFPRLALSDLGVIETVQFDPVEARIRHREAVATLLVKQCESQLRLMEAKEAVYQQARVLVCRTAEDELRLQRVLVMAVADEDLAEVLTEQGFNRLKTAVRESLVGRSIQLCQALVEGLQQGRELSGRLCGKIPPAWIQAIHAMRSHLAMLIDDPLTDIPPAQLLQLPRWVQAIEIRLEKLSGRLMLDAQWQREVDVLWDALRQRWPDAPHRWESRSAQLVQVRWQIEEFRVLCFAQRLKRGDKVSAKRILDALKDC